MGRPLEAQISQIVNFSLFRLLTGENGAVGSGRTLSFPCCLRQHASQQAILVYELMLEGSEHMQ